MSSGQGDCRQYRSPPRRTQRAPRMSLRGVKRRSKPCVARTAIRHSWTLASFPSSTLGTHIERLCLAQIIHYAVQDDLREEPGRHAFPGWSRGTRRMAGTGRPTGAASRMVGRAVPAASYLAGDARYPSFFRVSKSELPAPRGAATV